MAKIIRYIGIDFGTSSSAICYKDYDESGKVIKVINEQVEPVMVQIEGKYTAPTLMFIDDDGSPEAYGAKAQLYGNQGRGSLKENFKLHLESQNSDKRQEAGKLLGGFLRFLYDSYRRLPLPPGAEERTYISYPAKWEAVQRETQKPEDIRHILVEAAETAGFTNVQAMSEPRAAMQYFLAFESPQMKPLKEQQIIQEGKPVMVLLIDMGAGTTDLVLYRYVPGKPENYRVLTTWPRAKESDQSAMDLEAASGKRRRRTPRAKESDQSAMDHPGIFGGREIDELLAKYLNEFLKGCDCPVDRDSKEWPRFVQVCKTWKEETLSLAMKEELPLELPGPLYQFIPRSNSYMAYREKVRDKKILSNRDKLGEILREYLPVFPRLVNALIENAVQAGEIRGGQDIDLVILTGGHSRWYFVKEILSGKWVPGLHGNPQDGSGVQFEKIRREPHRILDGPAPELTVAKGLALSGVLPRRRDQPPRSTPLKKKVATTNVWVQLKIGQSLKNHIQIIKMGDGLPLHREFQGSYMFDYQPSKSFISTDYYINVGKDFHNMKEVKSGLEFFRLGEIESAGNEILEALSNWSNWSKRRKFVIKRAEAYLDLKVDMEENQTISLVINLYKGLSKKEQIDGTLPSWQFSFKSQIR